MTWLCWVAVLALGVLLVFGSYLQLLYLESLRLIKRETKALSYFRENLQDKLGYDTEKGALRFSLLKHVSLPFVGVFVYCAINRTSVPYWQVVLESLGLSLGVMLVSTYAIPQFLYRRLSSEWMTRVVPFAKLVGASISPLSAPLGFFQNLLDLGQPAEDSQTPADPSEHIEALITAGAEEGILEEGDRHLIQQVVAFGDKTVREVMTPRPNIIAIAADRPLDDLRQLVLHEQYSRIPAYEGNIDRIIGFVHVRDMFELDPEQRKEKTVRELIRPIRLVPETKPVNDLLREIQRDSTHMAVVIDEYGNTAGLATLEDLVEEILGEIRDEHEPGRDVRQESEDSFVAPGSLDLDRLEELLHFKPEEDTESTTVGGLVAEWLGHVPKVGESVKRDGIQIDVLAGNELRVEQVRVSRNAEAASV
ncbi:MAG TPA: hemolysin family protein [Bryobacteraceae bacterium]|jgi:CBS domain containing-hemolysin-like protein|nr:hemolysin family protein [Bryobacteraceae bacterium]